MKKLALFTKKWALIPFLLLLLTSLYAQNPEPVYVNVKTYNGELSPQSNQNLNQVFQDYGVTDFYLTYPNAITNVLKKVFTIKIADVTKIPDFALALEQLNSFENVQIMYSQRVLDCENPVPYNDPALNPNDGGDYIAKMNLPCAWEITKGSSQFPVAIIDQFMDGSHTDLAGKVIIENENQCLSQLAGDPHGYIITGCVTAIPDNGICTSGTGYDTEVGFYCAGTSFGGSNVVNDRITQAYDNGYKIINASYGPDPYGSVDFVTEMTNNGVVITHGTAHDFVPDLRNIPGFVLVGRVDNNNNYVPYNPFNGFPLADDATEADIDILVPSENNPRTTSFNGCGVPSSSGLAGNSAASPLVAGVVALMRSVNPCLSPAEIEEIIKVSHQGLPANADNPGDQYFGIITAGILDAELAVINARDYVWSDEEINTDMTIDVPKIVTGNLIIKTGTEVTISSTVQFNTNSRLIVERGARLIVDGGTLTVNICCGSQWRGIFVQGNVNKTQPHPFVPMSSLASDDAGIVRVVNGGTIEFARSAISTNNTYLGWPDYTEYFGGLIYTNQALFRHNSRAAQIMRYGVGSLRDKSQFLNSDFQFHTNAVTVWSSNGVTFRGNTFDDFKNRAIESYDAEVIVVDHNIFNGDEGAVVDEFSTAIDIISTHPTVFGSTIGSGGFEANEFNGGFYGVYLEANGSADKLKIENNQFSEGRYGVHIQSLAHYEISHNTFSGYEHAIRVSETGGFENIQSWNEIENCEIGTYVWHSNEGFIFANNCFDDNGFADVIIVGESAQPNFPGTVAPFQGEDGGPPAGNTFSKNGTDAIVIDGGDAGDVNPFTYFIPENTPTSSDLHPNPSAASDPYNKLTIAETMGQLANGNCGLIGPTPPVPPTICNVPAQMGDIQQSITDLQTAINQNPNGSEMEQICLKKMKLALIHRYALNDDEVGMYNYFNTEEDFNIKSTLYGYSVQKGNYDEAATYVNSFDDPVLGEQTNLSSEQNDFIAVQQINLNRLTQGENFEITAAQTAMLLDIAQKGRPLDGYARGLWVAIFGEHLPVKLPEVKGKNKVENRGAAITQNLETIKAGPNPVKDIFSIQLVENKTPTQVTVWNVQGEQVLTDNIKENNLNYQFSTHTFQSGIYFLTLTNVDGVVYQTKFIKL